MSRITVVVENTAAGQALLAEHGLSFWVEHAGRNVLFDTGQGYVLENNARRLNIPLETADAVVLSHGHFDHTGGLADVLDVQTHPVVFLHPAALASRYARMPDGTPREIGMPRDAVEAVRRRTGLVWTEAPTEIAAGLYVTGPIPRRTDFEDAGGPFFTDYACREPDDF
ncbi:MAG TPA: MBL fold metallo-hydrolase, partial [Candidatus Hydrogenedentes bacterium]|nr:MBL fold metallo-hydrolase [Candidatus Hydrogenedentota bacterium]